ncbi:MAG: J domain-containing protein [Methylobacter sp.]
MGKYSIITNLRRFSVSAMNFYRTGLSNISQESLLMIKDYYRVLGLADNAEDVVIRAVFKLLAHRYHPDKWLEKQETANRMMAEINEAYSTLSDSRLKTAYDKKRGVYESGSDFYLTLGVLDNVDAQMIHTAYKALSLKYRNLPDHNLTEKRLVEINLAYQVLSDSAKRKIYDVKQQAASYFFQSKQCSGLSLWKVYLLYNLVFYIFMAVVLYWFK